MFGFEKPFDLSNHIPDLKGKVIIVTGANTGLGLSTVKHLARRGATVYLGARNESKAIDAMAQLQTEGLGPGFGTVKWLSLDLIDPRKAKAAAEQFLTMESRLDVLVNNAGGGLVGTGETDDGIQQTMMVNYMSPYVFTETLLPLLSETAKSENSDVRIINLTSDSHKFVPKDTRFRNVEDLNNTCEGESTPFVSKYGLAKLANILHMKDLQKRLDALGIPIICISVDPGVSRTEGTETASNAFPHVFRYLFKILMLLVFTTPDVGAYNSTFAAASPLIREKPELYKGVFLTPVGKPTNPSAKAMNAELATELRETTNAFLTSIHVL